MGSSVSSTAAASAADVTRTTAGAELMIADKPDLFQMVRVLDDGSDGVRSEVSVETIVEGQIWVVHGVLTPEECKAFIDHSEQVGYEPATITTSQGPVMDLDTRNNWRCSFVDTAFANLFFNRIKNVVPETVAGGERKACGMNELFRFYKYGEGEYFRPHYDGYFKRDENERSYITAMIYLNQEFEGGATTFFDYKRFESGEWACQPKTGDCLLFMHAGWMHEGSVLTSGTKYAIRSDVMYRRSS